MHIYIVRHGETEANRAEEFQGHRDTPLTEKGTQQAKQLAAELSEQDFDMTFSSPLKRALDTAKILAQQVNTDVRLSEDLREICYGDWEGKSKDALRSTELWEEREANKYNFQHPGTFRGSPGQKYADLSEPVSNFFNDLLNEEYNKVLVITHLGVLRNVKNHFEEISHEVAVSFSPDPLKIYLLRSDNSRTETEVIDYT